MKHLTFWANLSEKDQKALMLGAYCILVAVFYFFIYAPVKNSINFKHQQLVEQKATLAWMLQIPRSAFKEPGLKKLSSVQLLAVISNQLKNSPLRNFPFHLQQAQQNDIQLNFEALPFSEALKWLWAFSKQYSFTLKSCVIEHTKISGVVKLSLDIAND